MELAENNEAYRFVCSKLTYRTISFKVELSVIYGLGLIVDCVYSCFKLMYLFGVQITVM